MLSWAERTQFEKCFIRLDMKKKNKEKVLSVRSSFEPQTFVSLGVFFSFSLLFALDLV